MSDKKSERSKVKNQNPSWWAAESKNLKIRHSDWAARRKRIIILWPLLNKSVFNHYHTISSFTALGSSIAATSSTITTTTTTIR